MVYKIDREEHERRRVIITRGLARGATWREMGEEAGLQREALRYYANRHFGGLLPERPQGFYVKPERKPSVREAKPPKETMKRICARVDECGAEFLSEKAEGAWLRLCPNCRPRSFVGLGMEGAPGRQLRGRPA